MQIIGRASKADLGRMERAGIGPEQAVKILLKEAEARHPKAATVIIQKSNLHDGFDIIAL